MLKQWFIRAKRAGRWGEVLRLVGERSWVWVVRFGGRVGGAVEGEVLVGGMRRLNARKIVDRHLDRYTPKATLSCQTRVSWICI